MRISREESLILRAKIVSLRSTCLRKKVGAIIAKEGRTISEGYCGSPSGFEHCVDTGCELDNEGKCQKTIHAELNSIIWAARNGISTEGAEMYSTTSPCITCAKAIINAGIKKVIYLEEYEDKRGIYLLKKGGVEVVKWEYPLKIEIVERRT